MEARGALNLVDDMAEVKTAKGIILWYMDIFNFDGWTSFWNTIYLREGHLQDKRLIVHEMCHINQIQREGRVAYFIKYCFYLIKYGYLDNPYEIEAREAEDNVTIQRR